MNFTIFFRKFKFKQLNVSNQFRLFLTLEGRLNSLKCLRTLSNVKYVTFVTWIFLVCYFFVQKYLGGVESETLKENKNFDVDSCQTDEILLPIDFLLKSKVCSKMLKNFKSKTILLHIIIEIRTKSSYFDSCQMSKNLNSLYFLPKIDK